MENINFINSCLTKLEQHYEGLRSPEERFYGIDWEDFEKNMEAYFEPFDSAEDKDKLRWFVSRMKNHVKLFWAKLADESNFLDFLIR